MLSDHTVYKSEGPMKLQIVFIVESNQWKYRSVCVGMLDQRFQCVCLSVSIISACVDLQSVWLSYAGFVQKIVIQH